MKRTIIILLLIISSTGFSQVTIIKSSLDSGGNILQNNNTMIMTTIGEIAIQENSQGQMHISEGFINPDMLTTLGIDNFAKMENIKIFPNPTLNFIKVDLQEDSNYQLTIIDINSKVIFEKSINAKSMEIDMRTYKRAAYFLIIKDLTKNRYQYFKIIKK